MSQGKDERRLSPRVSTLLKIEYPTMTGFFVDYLIDLSEGGLFIRTKLPLHVGETIEFSISFPGLLEPIPLEGIVRRLSTDRENPGVGVEFIFQDEETRKTIQRLVGQIGSEVPASIEAPAYRILVVDDNQRVLDMFKFALQRLELDGKFKKATPEIFTATNGREALDVLKSKHIDLVILDQYMPEIDGLSVLRMMRVDTKYKGTPVVIISTDQEQLKLTSLRSGANLFVAKPVRAMTLLSTLSALIQDTESTGDP